VALNRVLVHSEHLVVRLPYASVYRNGVDLAVVVQPSPLAPAVLLRGGTNPTFSADVNGAAVRAVDGREFRSGLAAPPSGSPVLRRRVRGDAPGWSALYLWLSPLPPTGRFALALEWPSAGVTHAAADLDSEALRAAAGQASEAWVDTRPEWRPLRP
jgi:hypothetical protein